jgi:hypothetical protein
MAKNIYSILSSFKTNIADEEYEDEDYIVKKEDFVSEESSPSEDDLTEISPESLIRILEKKEMFIEKKCPNYLEAFQAPEEPVQPKELFETPEESEKAPEEPEKAPEEPEKAPEEPEKAPEEPEKAPEEPEKAPEEPKPVVVKQEEFKKVNHLLQIQNLLRESITTNPLKKLTNTKKSMYSNVIKYESVRTRFF